jgi:hypothetical protein
VLTHFFNTSSLSSLICFQKEEKHRQPASETYNLFGVRGFLLTIMGIGASVCVNRAC